MSATTKKAIRSWLVANYLVDCPEAHRLIDCIFKHEDLTHLEARVEHYASMASGEDDDMDAYGFTLTTLVECHEGPHTDTCQTANPPCLVGSLKLLSRKDAAMKIIKVKNHTKSIGRSCMHCGASATVTTVRVNQYRMSVWYCQAHAEEIIPQMAAKQEPMTTDTTTPTQEMLEWAEYEGKRFQQIKAEFTHLLISVHFATGTKVHAGYAGSSVALCGGWMKYNGLAYRQFSQPDCQRCVAAMARMTETERN